LDIQELDIHDIEVNRGYRILRDGRVYRGKRELKGGYTKGGYLQMTLGGPGKWIRALKHRLVATKFCERKEGCNLVNHIDGDVTNCHADNLEWVTASQNQLHAQKHDSYHSDVVAEAKRLRSLGMSYERIGKAVGVSYTSARTYCLL
jgi:hypothetical protein